MYPTVDVKCAIGTIVAMAGSTKPVESIPSYTQKINTIKKEKGLSAKIYVIGVSMRSSKEKVSTHGF